MATRSKVGQPRTEQPWQSMMRRTLFVSYYDDADVHTALHMAGTEAQELMIAAVREYIERHQHPAGQIETQQRVAMEGLGMGGVKAPVFTPIQARQTIAIEQLTQIAQIAQLAQAQFDLSVPAQVAPIQAAIFAPAPASTQAAGLAALVESQLGDC